MATVTLIGPRRLNVGGVLYKRGEAVELEDHLAIGFEEDPRFRVKGVRLDAADRPATARAGSRAPGRPIGDNLMAAISEAIADLDVEDDEAFDRNGKPAVRAISAILGYEITAVERDRAMNRAAKAHGQLDPVDGAATAPQPNGLKFGKTRLTPEQRLELQKKAAQVQTSIPTGNDRIVDREEQRQAAEDQPDEPTMEMT